MRTSSGTVAFIKFLKKKNPRQAREIPSPSTRKAKRDKRKQPIRFSRRGVPDHKLLINADPFSFQAEQFKALRTKLLFPESGRSLRSFVVTSVDLAAGNSFIAANLALSVAQNVDQREVLLIDCDMRMPSIHELFGLGEVPGLSEYLSRPLPLAPFLIRPPIPNLTVLPAGATPDNPAELLCSQKMADLVSETYHRYSDRYLIIDLPPPQIIPEAEVVARLADGIVIVVNYRTTPKDKIMELIDIFGGERILGIVLNRFDTSMHSTTYRLYRKYLGRHRRRLA